MSAGTDHHSTARPPGPVPAPLGSLLAPVYEQIIASRNRRFDRGVDVRRFDRPVISIGNLSVGGTGKTPTVRKIVRWLIADGLLPAIAMRGYKAAPGKPGDEAVEYERTLDPWPTGTRVPIVAQPNRVLGLERLLTTPTGRRVNRIVLDDGFQHRRIARDLDIVLIDATRDPWNDRLLPAGWLREPVSSLARAHAAVITHAEAVEPGAVERLMERIASVAPSAVVAAARHEWTELRVHQPSGDRVEEPAWLRSRRPLAVCGIANPGPFIRTVEQCCGGTLAGRVVLPDHDEYGPSTVERLLREIARLSADVVVTTEKDWAKLSEVAPDRWPVPVVCPRLDIVFERGEDQLRGAIAAL